MSKYVFEFKFLKWEDFNPPLKSRRAAPTWCRLDHAIFEHPALSGQSTHKQNLFIVMLTRAIARSGYGQLNGTTIHLMCKLKQHDVKTYASHLESLGIIEYNFREVSKKILDRRLTDKTDKTDRPTDSSDGVAEAEPTLPKTKLPKVLKPLDDEQSPTYQVWLAYAGAHSERYGETPKRNAKSMGQCKHLVQRLGLEDALRVVRFYLKHNKSYYVQKCHMLDACLSDAEALLTQMRANFKVTASFATDADRKQTNQQVFENFAAERGIKL